MKKNLFKILLSTAAIATCITSCKPNPDTDTPLDKKISPSIYLGGQNNFLYALNPTNGLKKWEFNVQGGFSASPYLYANTLFLGSNTGVLYKFDPSIGTSTQSKVAFTGGVTASPVGKDNYLFVPYGNKITCIDIKPDTVKWTFTAGSSIYSSPSIKDTQMVFGCDDGFVYMIDNRTGDLIWKSANYFSPLRTSPKMDDSNVYIGCNNFKVYALTRRSGSEKWNYTTMAPVYSSPIVYGGNVFIGSDDNFFYCIDKVSGIPRWKTQLNDRIRSSAFLHIDGLEQILFVGSYDKQLYALDALDGKKLWAFSTLGLIASSPVVYDKQVFIGSYDKNIYALDIKTGVKNWFFEINGLIDVSPVVDNNNSSGSGINSSVNGSYPN